MLYIIVITASCRYDSYFTNNVTISDTGVFERASRFGMEAILNANIQAIHDSFDKISIPDFSMNAVGF